MFHCAQIVLLCTDLLILVKAPAPPLDADPNSPVELYTVVRLKSGAVAGARKGSSNQSPVVGTGTSGEGPVSLFGKDEDSEFFLPATSGGQRRQDF